MEKKKAKRITITGIVQGVGFRPFIYRLASELDLKGYVKNMGGSEVIVHVEGSEDKINELIRKIRLHHPPRALIERIDEREVPIEGWKEFAILESGNAREARSMVPPDIGICDDCLRELRDERSRFYRYPFHSCVNCGPRYTIMLKPPYDRANTSMTRFPLCAECEGEYFDVNNERRFYAQGISCPICGPKLHLLDSMGRRIESRDPIGDAGKLIDEGYIVAVKGIGGYHLASLATSSEVLSKLRERKRRGRKPFALMALDLEAVERNAFVSESERDALLSPQRPIVLLRRKEESPISPEVAPGLKTLGFMLPYSALHFLLLESIKDRVAVMTSANISGEPTCTELSCVIDSLGGVVDFILDHDRRIANRADDSVVKFAGDRQLMIRRSRGYAPAWIEVGFTFPKNVISLGGFLNNTGAIAFENKIVLTPHVGDMETYSSMKSLFSEINKLGSWYGLIGEKAAVALDKHPSFPQNFHYKKFLHFDFEEEIRVQHHCSHSLQAAAEIPWDELKGSAAIAIDGTGYGEDGGIWGGEILSIDEAGCRRIASLRGFPLLGGDLAVKEAVRPLAGVLWSLFGSGAEDLLFSFNLPEDLKRRGMQLLGIIESENKGIPSSTSLGRFLDAVGCALGMKCFADYDGEIPMILEDAAEVGEEGDLAVRLEEIDGVKKISLREPLELIPLIGRDEAGRYIYTLLSRIGEAFGRIAAESTRSEYVLVSGGAAVNRIILKGIERAVEERGRKLIVPSLSPPGDGGLSLGQAIYAGLMLNGYIKER